MKVRNIVSEIQLLLRERTLYGIFFTMPIKKFLLQPSKISL